MGDWKGTKWVFGISMVLAGCFDRDAAPLTSRPLETILVFGVVVGQTMHGPVTEIFVGASAGPIAKVSQNPGCFSHGPALNPSGEKVVYVSCSQPYGEDLFVAVPGRLEVRELTRTPDVENHPRWSPDGRWIAFDNERAGNRGIVLIDSAGGQYRLIADPILSFIFGGWSHDGSAIVCSASGADSTESQIIKIQIPSLQMQQLTSGPGRKSNPEWSASGLVAYVRDGVLRSVRSDGTSDTLIAGPPDSVTGHISWSSDGDWLLFEGRSQGRSDVYRVSSDRGQLVNLTGNSFPGSSPTLSPDDRQIAYVADLNGLSKIYLMEVDGSGKRPLTEFRVDEFEPSWRR